MRRFVGFGLHGLRALRADKRPFVGQEFFRRLASAYNGARFIRNSVIHNARVHNRRDDIVLFILPETGQIHAEHGNALDVIRLPVPDERLKLVTHLVEERVRHAGAHLIPLFVLPAILHADVQIADLLLHGLFGEVGVKLLELRDRHREHGTRCAGIHRTAAVTSLCSFAAEGNEQDNGQDDQGGPKIPLVIVIAAADIAAAVIVAAPVTAAPVTAAPIASSAIVGVAGKAARIRKARCREQKKRRHKHASQKERPYTFLSHCKLSLSFTLGTRPKKQS